MEKKRFYNLDLLRIVSMLMIVTLHLLSYGNVVNSIERYSIQFFILNLFQIICLVCVNQFLLLSGYFYESKFSLQKVFRLVFEVFFYSIVIFAVLVLTGVVQFNLIDLLLSLFPILTRQYWFMTSYLACYILSPFLKKIINLFTRKSNKTLLIILFIFFVVYYNLFFFTENLNFGGATGLPWFIFVYLCGAYIKKYNIHLKNALIYFILGIIICFLSRGVFWLGSILFNKEILFTGSNIFTSVYNSLLTFPLSIVFFLLFLNIKINYKLNKIIAFFSKSAFSVYLIHDNNFLRSFLWNSLNLSNFLGTWYYFIICILVIPVAIFLVAVLVDKLRILIENVIFIFLKKPIIKLQSSINNLMDEKEECMKYEN